MKKTEMNDSMHCLKLFCSTSTEIFRYFSQVGYLSNATANIKFIHCWLLSPSWNAHIMTVMFLLVVCESVSIRQRFR